MRIGFPKSSLLDRCDATSLGWPALGNGAPAGATTVAIVANASSAAVVNSRCEGRRRKNRPKKAASPASRMRLARSGSTGAAPATMPPFGGAGSPGAGRLLIAAVAVLLARFGSPSVSAVFCAVLAPAAAPAGNEPMSQTPVLLE